MLLSLFLADFQLSGTGRGNLFSMLNKLQIVFIILIIAFGGLYLYTEKTGQSVSELLSQGSKPIRIGNIPFTVVVARTQEERRMGLSGRDEIGADGMLFIFDESDYHGIWMKDMKFAIDVIWIDENLQVVEVTENLQPESYPKVFEPSRPVKYVIETRPYLSDTFSIGPGDKVELPPGL